MCRGGSGGGKDEEDSERDRATLVSVETEFRRATFLWETHHSPSLSDRVDKLSKAVSASESARKHRTGLRLTVTAVTVCTAVQARGEPSFGACRRTRHAPLGPHGWPA